MSGPSEHTIRRINSIAEQVPIRRYLEIGVETGATFFPINAEYKVAVDPSFLFDEKSRQSSNLEFHRKTSDDFFSSYKGPPFDFIYIDGLHYFEQVLRDFTNALGHSHSKTIILVDDVHPTDIFSSFRNWSEAISLRRKTGSQAGDWHGDVYKMVFFVNDFWPTLSYFVIDEGACNKQMIVWPQSRERFSPIFNDVEKVASATYADLLRNEDKLHYASEKIALPSVVAKIKS